jgi:hypothetical protein
VFKTVNKYKNITNNNSQNPKLTKFRNKNILKKNPTDRPYFFPQQVTVNTHIFFLGLSLQCIRAVTVMSGVSVMLRPGCRFFAASTSGEVISFPVLAKKNHCLIKSITARKAGIIKVSYTTDKVDVRLPVFANTQYQNLAQKNKTSLYLRRDLTIQSL